MRKIKKIFKYLTYAMLYLLVSVGSAYGVITISVNNAASQNGGNNGSAENAVPEQITNVVNGIMNSPAMDVDLDVALSSPSQNVRIVVSNSQIDFSNGIENVSVQGKISISLDEQNFDIDLTYLNNCLFIEGFNNKFCISTNNLMESVTEILDIVNVEMPSLGDFDLASLDFNSILGMFSNFTETKDGNIITLDITLPVVEGHILLTCDQNYKVQSLSLPSLNFNDMEISVNGNIEYPEEAIIEDKIEEDFINLTTVVDLSKNILSYINRPVLTLGFDISYENYNFDGILTLNTDNFDFSVDVNYENYNLTILNIANNLYLEFENLFVKFNLNDLEKLNKILNQFDIDIPAEKIISLVNSIKNKDFASVLSSFEIKTDNFDISSLDLSIIENISKIDENISISIKNIGNIVVNIENNNFAGISFDGLGIEANVLALDDGKIELEENEENYIDIGLLLPIAENIVSIVKSDLIKAEIELDFNGTAIPVSVVIDKANGLDVYLTIEYNGIALDAYLVNNTVYICTGNIKLKGSFDDIKDIALKVCELLNIEMPSIDNIQTDDLIDKFMSVLDRQSNPLLFKSLSSTQNKLNLVLFNDFTFEIENNENELKLSSIIENFDIKLAISALDSFDCPVIDESSYSDLINILPIFENIYNYVKENTIFAFDFDVTYKNNQFVGNIAFDSENFNLVANINYQGKNIRLLLIGSSIYIEFETILAKFDINNLTSISSILQKFDIDIDLGEIVEIFNNIKENKLKALLSIVKNIEFDTNNIDLSILSSILIDDNFIGVSLNGIGNITLSTKENSIDTVTFNRDDISACIVTTEEYDFSLKENYTDLANIIPIAENVIDLFDCNKFYGNAVAHIGDIEVELDYEVYIQDEIFVEANVEIFGQNISVIYYQNEVYVSLLDTKLKVNVSNIQEIIAKVCEIFGLTFDFEMPSVDFDIESLTNIDSFPINKFDIQENSITVNLLDDIQIELSLTDDKIEVSLQYGDITALISVNGASEEKEVSIDDEYVDIQDILPIVENVYNYVKSNKYFLKIDAEYQDYNISGFVNFDGALEFAFTSTIESTDVSVMLYQDSLYISAANINLSFDLDDLDDAFTFIKDAFKIDIEEIFQNIEDSYGIDVSALIDFVRGNGKLVLPEMNLDFDILLIENILNSITLSLNTENIAVSYDNVSANISMTNEMIDTISFSYDDISAVITISDEAFDFSPDQNYFDIMELISYGQMVLDIIDTKKVDLSAIVTKIESGDVYNGRLQLDFTDIIKMSAVVNDSNGDLNVKANVEDGMFYLNFNGLCIKIDEDNLNELIYIACEMFGIDYTLVPFIGKIDLDLDLSQIEMKANLNIDPETIAKVLKIVKKFEKQGENLVIVLDNSIIYGNDNASDMIITAKVEDNKLKAVTVENVYTSSDLTNSIKLEFNLNDLTTFNSVDKTKNYIDISGSNELIKAFINMTTTKYFNITGKVDIAGEVVGIDITNLAQTILPEIWFDIKIRVLEDKSIELFGSLGEIPAVVGLDNDVPYKFGDTESGSDRFLYFYYKDGYVYLYRTEKVKVLFGASSRTYEKQVKISLDTLLADPMYYILQYGVGLKENVMELINEAFEKSKHRTAPIDLGNIIKAFTVNNQNSYTVVLNMKEITNNDDLDTLSLTLGLSKDKDNKNYIANAIFSIYMPLADSFKMTLSSQNITLKNYGSPFDMSKLYQFVNNYPYSEGEFWQASNGDWELASESKYTLRFIDRETTLSSSQVKPGSQITLPSLSTRVVDDGITKTTYTFGGWFTSSNFASSSKFTSTTMPGHDTILYAKWNETVEYYRTITFVTNSDYSVDSIKKLVGQSITIPSLGEKIIVSGTTTYYYDFNGWFTSLDFVEESKFEEALMPETDTVVYAKWTLNHFELSTHDLNVYDNNVLVYNSRVKEGDAFDFSSLNTNTNTRFYLDANYSTLYTGEFVMGENDVELHIRNKYTINFVSAYGDVLSEAFEYYQGETVSYPARQTYVVDDGNTRTTYTFVNWSENISIMPNSDKTIEANWSIDVKHYYTITYDLRWYIVFGTTAGCAWKTAPTPIASEKFLEGTVINLNQDKYRVSGIAYTTAIHIGSGKKYTATSWGTSAWSDYTSGGKGFTSYTVTQNQTLYACWAS